ncbi:hypothetical protein [Spongiactinospora sp. TRM90649]|uniref:hypothetical protein n=1 Tax=Spongiactinospora sp. TRM90649 TaxID=3031114 RepID=UPI0023F6A367|nr:hypothetical protein [Spongiactinospora sp. TRM90649]MDF5754653.1 hypothetical protein [Spongiactinospora sp. TRM90649]
MGGDPTGEPWVVEGSAKEVATRLAALTDLGFTAFSLSPLGPDLETQAEALAKEVIPAVHDAVRA